MCENTFKYTKILNQILVKTFLIFLKKKKITALDILRRKFGIAKSKRSTEEVVS